jgi:hypothetical protein
MNRVVRKQFKLDLYKFDSSSIHLSLNKNLGSPTKRAKLNLIRLK